MAAKGNVKSVMAGGHHGESGGGNGHRQWRKGSSIKSKRGINNIGGESAKIIKKSAKIGENNIMAAAAMRKRQHRKRISGV
jgi:hypothetical protein